MSSLQTVQCDLLRTTGLRRPQTMYGESLHRFLQHRTFLVENISVSDSLLHLLIVSGVISQMEYAAIKGKQNQERPVERLLDILQNIPESFEKFCSALKEDDQRSVAEMLMKGKDPALRKEHCSLTKDMRYEINRLATFTSWPQSAPITAQPTRLAKAGFLYEGMDVTVICFRCNGRISTWNEHEMPMEKHKKTFPSCSFAQGQDTTNVILIPSPIYRLPEWSSNDVIGPELVKTNLTTYKKALEAIKKAHDFSGSKAVHGQSIVSRAPRAASIGATPNPPDMKDEKNRLLTYYDWPSTAPIKPEELAAAGFYCLHQRDRVECAFCHGILLDWVQGDIAMEEHRRHFPQCTMAATSRMIGGDNSDMDVRQERQTTTDSLEARMNSLQLQPSQSEAASQSAINLNHSEATGLHGEHTGDLYGTLTAVEYRVEAREIKARLDSPMAQTLIRIGYDPYLVAKTIEKRLKTTGDDFDNIEAFSSALLALEPELAAQGLMTRRAVTTESEALQGSNARLASMAVPRFASTARTESNSVNNSNQEEANQNTTSENTGRASPNANSHSQAASNHGATRENVSTSAIGHTASNNTAASVIGTEKNQAAANGETGNAATSCATASNNQQASGESRANASKGGKKKKNKRQKNGSPVNSNGGTTTSQSTGTGDQNARQIEHLLKEKKELEEKGLCKICFVEESNIVFLPCGHIASCNGCASRLKDCPICRRTIRGVVKTYRA